MELRGTINAGRIVLDDGRALPEGTRITLRVIKRADTKRSKAKQKLIAKVRATAVRTGISDLADRHDEFLTGAKPVRNARKRKGRR